MIFVTGDTHGTDLLCIHHFCDNHPELTKNDYIIIGAISVAFGRKKRLKEI